MVTLPGVGHPNHCSERVVWHLWWRSPSGNVFLIEACASHVPPDLDGRRSARRRRPGTVRR
jgi:hypothetical protein